jgi:uncharacterized hydrophobic protein (TIGR00271 family)
MIVIGKDRKALAEMVRRRMSEHLEGIQQKVMVEPVDDDPAAILEIAQTSATKAMLMIHHTDGSDQRKQLFQQSSVPTLLINARQPPPESSSEVISLFRQPSLVGTLVSEKLLNLVPSNVLCDDIDLPMEDLESIASEAFQSEKCASTKLILCGVDDFDSTNGFFNTGWALLNHDVATSVALAHNGHSYAETIAAKIRQWAATIAPPMDRDQRTELADDLRLGSKPNLEFLGLMSAAAMLASFGLLQNSGAVVIGAMLIAPLMTPILGAGLALAQGNKPLFQSAILTVILGFVGALVSSLLFGWLCLFFDAFDMLFKKPEITPEMWARCKPSPLDFCVGLVGGIAASYARTRRHLSSALAGAAIAAALVPPIATTGLQLAFGSSYWGDKPDGVPVWGPLHLVAINVVTIMIGSSFVLWARGMRSERTLNLKDRWTVRMAMVLTLALLALIWVLRPES